VISALQHFLVPECALQCGSEHDFFDDSIFCSGGDFELPNAGSTCQRVVVPEVAEVAGGDAGTFVDIPRPVQPGQPPRVAGTLWRCLGTPRQITEALQGLIFMPPKLYTSGRPPQSFIFWRFTFDVVDPQVYRKDINITVLPVNSPPQVSGGDAFRVQEDRPTILSPSTPGGPGMLTVAILDDAAYQLPHEISVALTIDPMFGSGSISIGGSRDPPFCPGCPPGSGGAVIVDEETCSCRNGAQWSQGASPWYGKGESLIVHSTMRLMNKTVLPNLEYMSGPNVWGQYMALGEDRIKVEVFDNGYAQWNQSTRAIADFSINLTHTGTVKVEVESENDPPVPVMPLEILIHQDHGGRLVGGHFVDFDAIDFAADPYSILYEMQVRVETGFVALDLASPNCSVLFRPVLVQPKPLVQVNVDARDAKKLNNFASITGLFIDGSPYCKRGGTFYEEWHESKSREDCEVIAGGILEEGAQRLCWQKQKCNKIAFFKFNLAQAFGQDLHYPSASITFRALLLGCAPNDCLDENSECEPAAEMCKGLSGRVTVNAVSCNWEEAPTPGPQLNYNHIRTLEVEQKPVELGSAWYSARSNTWIEIPLDVEKVRQAAEASEFSAEGMICVSVEAGPTLNKTLVLFGGTKDQDNVEYQFASMKCQEQTCSYYERAGWQKMPMPQIVLVQGRAYNCTGTGCSKDCTGNKGFNIYDDVCTGTLWKCGDQDMPEGSDPYTCKAFGGAKIKVQKQLNWREQENRCVLSVNQGTSLQDKSFRVRGTIDPLNVLLGDIAYANPSTFNNALGSNLQNVTVSVRDTTAQHKLLLDGGWFDSFEPDRYVSVSGEGLGLRVQG